MGVCHHPPPPPYLCCNFVRMPYWPPKLNPMCSGMRLGKNERVPGIFSSFRFFCDPWQPLEVGQSRDFAILEVFLYISKMPKSQKNSTWSPWVGGLPKIENFKICQNLLIWTKTNIESQFGGHQGSVGYQTKNFRRSDSEIVISCIPSNTCILEVN